MSLRSKFNRFFTKRNMLIFLSLVLICLLLVWLANTVIKRSAENKTYSDVNTLPDMQTGLLLGTTKFLNSGRVNRYYSNRISAAAELMASGKIEKIIVSGDNSRKDYDEPSLMRNDLIAAGVDSTRIFRDYAGFRTLDSVFRAKEIFGQDSILVISQQFHNERAIYLANRSGMHAIGFNAVDVTGKGGIKTTLREYLARVKVFVDLVTGTEPRFLGEKIDMDKPEVIEES
ncbi:MAG: ElyC/SanA/YdcF family protein [Bacteroidota bacterium]